MAVNDRLSGFLGAGFYYKTFMWPASFWKSVYEPVIRNAAGLGKAADDHNYREIGLKKGFLEVVSGPMVRSSYRAERALEKNNAGL